MQSRNQHVHGQGVDWRFSPTANALETAYPSTRQRTTAAIAGITCAVGLYAWTVPPAKQLKPGHAPERATLTHIVPDALRALTGLTASTSSDSAHSTGTVSGAGIRN